MGALSIVKSSNVAVVPSPGLIATVLPGISAKASPTRAPSAEAAARGRETTRETVEAFAQAVLEDIHPRDSWRAAKAFREHIAVEMAKRALTKSIELGGGAVRE